MTDARSEILIAYDGSSGARDAIRGAPELLGRRKAVVLYVFRHVEQMAGGMGVAVRMPQEAVDAADEHARQVAREGAELARQSGFDAEPAAVPAEERVADKILQVARERDAAAVVVGSRGLAGVRSALLGSVSSGLVHAADRPVVVVPHSEAVAAGTKPHQAPPTSTT